MMMMTSFRSFFLYGCVLHGMTTACHSFLSTEFGVANTRHRSSEYLHPHFSQPQSQQAEGNEVSDAEALIACYTYLRRRKRVGTWEHQERRKRMKAAAASPQVFLEEDLSKIASRLNRENNNKNHHLRDTITDDDIDDEDEEGDDARLRPFRTSASTEVWSGEFTSFPEGPSSTRDKRSNAAKRTWMDSDFRTRWYEKRWAERVRQESPETLEERALEQQVRALPSGFLGSDVLSKMTEAEIQEAIQGYLATRGKRADSRKKTMNERKAMLDQQMTDAMKRTSLPTEQRALSQDSLFMVDENALREAQKRRSERAKVLYQKRLQNENTKTPHDVSPPKKRKGVTKYFPSSATPRDSMLRITYDLDMGVLPSLQDVELIMKPGKIGKRRDVLRRILADFFDMRGRCVPVAGSNDEFQFVTSCAIHDLGYFVMDLIRDHTKAEGSQDLTVTGSASPSSSERADDADPLVVEPAFRTPLDALLRIQQALDTRLMPSVTDVKLLLQSKRIAGRQQILRRILSECFDVKGKCVPTAAGEMEFVANCTLDDLGNLIVEMLGKN